MKTKYMFAVCVLAMAPLLATSDGCQPSAAKRPSADIHQQEETAKALAELDRQIGMPDVVRGTERKLAKDIIELRDKEIPTFTYLVNLEGKLIFLGQSIGYGLPYSAQFTNPQKLVDAEQVLGINLFEDSSRVQSMPQADPSGMFIPDGLSATWVMLVGPDGKPHPVYVEQEIIVSPFKLHGDMEVEPLGVNGPE